MTHPHTARTSRPRPESAGSRCFHCGTPRVTVQLGELAVFARRNPETGLTDVVRFLFKRSTFSTPVYLCPNCFCITTDPGEHAH